jgi:hypothetical protein
MEAVRIRENIDLPEFALPADPVLRVVDHAYAPIAQWRGAAAA